MDSREQFNDWYWDNVIEDDYNDRVFEFGLKVWQARDADIEALKAQLAERDALIEDAKCAFADIAFNTDLKLTGVRSKAKRKYSELALALKKEVE